MMSLSLKSTIANIYTMAGNKGKVIWHSLGGTTEPSKSISLQNVAHILTGALISNLPIFGRQATDQPHLLWTTLTSQPNERLHSKIPPPYKYISHG